MNLLSPQNYIPSNISTSMDELEVSLRSAPADLQKAFRQKHSCDVMLKFGGIEHLAHRYVLEKTSTIFTTGFFTKNGEKWCIQVIVKAKTQIFTKILSCMYGYSTTIRRYDIHEAYQIAKALQIPSLLSQLQNDMITHFDQYDIFPLLKLATKEELHELIDICYDQLDIEMYEPMRYNKSGLFLCESELFKTVIKRHNFQKSGNEKFGLSSTQIRFLIDEYCFINGFEKEQKQKLISEIDDKQNIRYYISLNQVLRKPSTPSRVKSTSQIFQRTTLTLPRQKDLEKNLNFFPKGRRLSPCVNSFHRNNEELMPQCNQFTFQHTTLGSSPLICKSDYSSKSNSLSNISTENVSQQNRSRRQSAGSSETIFNSKITDAILKVIEKEKILRESQASMKLRVLEMVKKLKNDLHESKQKGQKIHKIESSLEEMKAQIKCSKEKIKELQKTVDNVAQMESQKEIKMKFDKLFETSIALDLSQSTQINLKEPQKE